MTQNNTRCRVVSQIGTVARVSGSYADIEILQTSACSTCTLKGACNPGESAVKTIHARLEMPVETGERVRIDMDARHGRLGVLVSYVLPLVIVLATLFLLLPRVSRESWAGLISLATLIPYFGIIFLARGFFEQVIQFRATPLEKEGAM